MIEPPIWHGPEERGIAFRIENLLHVDVVKRMLPEGAPLDRRSEPLFDDRRPRRRMNAIYELFHVTQLDLPARAKWGLEIIGNFVLIP